MTDSSSFPLVLSCRAVGELDRLAEAQFALPGRVLMENAGRSVVDILLQLGCRGRVVIACGKGNNGGDGFVIARWLHARGIATQTLLFARPDELAGDALANYRALVAADLPLWVAPEKISPEAIREPCGEPQWIVDALLGTGFHGETRPPLATAIEVLNSIKSRKLAVDLPSGLNGDTGHSSRATFRADHTVTFVAPKPGLLTPAAATYVGTLHTVPLGVPQKLIEHIQQISSPIL
jgi:NAD(P)H-hydrate epimerase